MIVIEEKLNEMRAILHQLDRLISKIGSEAIAFRQRLEESGAQSDYRRHRQPLRALAADYARHGRELERLNDQFGDVWALTSSALEIVLNEVVSGRCAEDDDVRMFVTAVESMAIPTRGAKKGLMQAIRSIDALPHIEPTFDKATKRIAAQLRRFARHLDQVVLLAVRFGQKGKTRP